ncbi:hypothetical protein NTE_01209 [Candidatus Nitrososphaera evergladensis SR1]|uniref:Uncharacterized protein n=1 Tax=Candidatus Nitrososphaera evergladensis SR1 TaxID=1459636 RepID=A0A075MP31_9ARCH|nr:hypothetical protein [Candidatus Nitrososphaera evergladensis]AIF83281.1 hypothetical protein NTE_01209 [Candidatus Nitrososphaera evergladensis SR1]
MAQITNPVEVDQSGRKFQYIQNNFANIGLQPNEERVVLDVKEKGEIFMYEMHGNSRHLGLSVDIWADSGAQISIMGGHLTFEKLLQKAWGLSAGEVAPVSGVSPDPHGEPNYRHPYLLRFKTTTEQDITGEDDERYSMAYTPNPYTAYGSRIRVTLVNHSNETGVVEDFVLTRKVWL